MEKNRNLVSSILIEYKQKLGAYETVKDIAEKMLLSMLKENSIMTMEVNCRLKALKSLSKKIEKKSGKYHVLSDITDILGCRVICYFTDDVDVISRHIEQMFTIDWVNSIDKRRVMNPTVFGYLSVHYICSLKPSEEYPKELCGLKFEIQVRSILQHVWAEIEHDLGYKSEFAIPRDIRRDFSKAASILEIADEKFADIRKSLKGYDSRVKTAILENRVDGLFIDLISLREYMQHNSHMQSFIRHFEKECGVEVSVINPENYLIQLDRLKIHTLEDINRIIDISGEKAIRIAKYELKDYDLDIISSNMILRCLCYAELIRRDYNSEYILDFLKMTYSDERAALQLENIQRFKLSEVGK